MRRPDNQNAFWQRRSAHRLPVPLERNIHIAIADRLRAECRPEFWWSHIGHGELRTKETAALLQRMGLQRGIFDFLLINKRTGVHFWLEIKRGFSAKVSDGQDEFAAMLRAAYVPFYIARSYDAAIERLKLWGAL
jgi:hypothetical protein